MNISRKQINFALIQQTFEETVNPIDRIVKNIKTYSQENDNLLEKYNEEFFLTYFDRNTIQQAIIKLGSQVNQKKELKLEQFIRIFLGIVIHKEQQTLFLAMSLRRLFLRIREQTNNQNGVKFADFTNYLCQRIARQNQDLVVMVKQVPKQKLLPDVTRIRQIDINAPLVLKNSQSDAPKIAKQKKKKDKKLTQKKPVFKLIFNPTTKTIITMGRLASTISFYSLELQKLPKTITPKTPTSSTHQIAILSFDFDHKNQRIGAIVNGVGIAFWEAADGFQTQKLITKYVGDKIFYLDLWREWVTVDKNGLYFWDLKQQKVLRTIKEDDAILINDICEITHLRCLCVSYTGKDDKKFFIVYKNFKPIVRYELGCSGCHTLHYNICTQTLVTAGYHSQLQVYEIQNKTFSVNLKKQLKGHTSIITCVSSILQTNFLISGDDSGQVRIWQLCTMKCLQVVRISKYLNQVFCTGDKLLWSDSRLNIMDMDTVHANRGQNQRTSGTQVMDMEIVYQFVDEENDVEIIVTRKDIRRLKLKTGTIELIFIVCANEEEVTAVCRLGSGLVVGTSRGYIKLWSLQGKLKWQLSAHEGQITQLKYDRKTRFIFSLGNDSKLMIWPQKSILNQGVKKIISVKSRSFNLLSLFSEVRLLFLASSQESQICVWDYENVKLLTIIATNAPVLFMQLNVMFKILMVSTIYDEVYFIKLNWKSSGLEYELVYDGDSRFEGLRKSRGDKKLTINRDLIDEEGRVNGELMDLTLKNKKTSKDISSKRSINNSNKNKQNRCSNSKNVFLTSTKLAKDDFISGPNQVKPSFKPSFKHIEIDQSDQNQLPPMPSIKLIQQQSQSNKHCLSNLFNFNNNNQQQQTISTLKTLKKIDAQLTTRIQIKQTQELGCLLIMANSKGQIRCYNIDLLIKEQFQGSEAELKKNQSPHLYRPTKEDYQIEINKKKHQQLTLQSMIKISKVKKAYFKLIWKQDIQSKQPISTLTVIQMKKTYLSVGMTDGTCRYYDLISGQLKGTIKMNLPLPTVWAISIQKDAFIRRNVYETLLVLDDILTNHGFQMLSKQYKAINITKFLQILKRQKGIKFSSKTLGSKNKIQLLVTPNLFQQKEAPIKLLQEQYTTEDMHSVHNQINPPKQTLQNSLKSLQAYKRVKQIKEQMLIEVKQRNSIEESSNGVQKISNEVLRQKEQLQRLLAPNYFPVLGEYGVASRLNKSIQIGSLQERSIMLLEKINKKKKLNSEYLAGNVGNNNRLKRQASQLPLIHGSQGIKRGFEIVKDLTKQIEGKQNNPSLLAKLTTVSSTYFNNNNNSNYSETNKASNNNSTGSSYVVISKPKIALPQLTLSSNTQSTSYITTSQVSSPSDLPQDLRKKLLKMTSLTTAVQTQQSRRTRKQQLITMTKRYGLDDKPMKQILGEINQKLGRYKKMKYANRSII